MCTHTPSAIISVQKLKHLLSLLFIDVFGCVRTRHPPFACFIRLKRIIIVIQIYHQITEYVCKKQHLYKLCLSQYTILNWSLDVHNIIAGLFVPGHVTREWEKPITSLFWSKSILFMNVLCVLLKIRYWFFLNFFFFKCLIHTFVFCWWQLLYIWCGSLFQMKNDLLR